MFHGCQDFGNIWYSIHSLLRKHPPFLPQNRTNDGSEKHGEAAAQVVCRFILFWHKTIIHIFSQRELGYDGGNYTNESHFGQVSDDFMMDDVKCEGTEEKLLDCPHTTEDDCKGNEGLGVICIPNHTTIQGVVYLLLIHPFKGWGGSRVVLKTRS